MTTVRKRQIESAPDIEDKTKELEKGKERLYPPFRTGGQTDSKEDARKPIKPLVLL